ncbi:DUF998 domain-containing protein [Micromonospora tarensis]|uniref:DUF998 domain-containing protein n=1 Tax=Micromonospora tarensis TaxID=2806100 RepID=UPI003898FCB7
MRAVPNWAVATAAAAPVLLVTGWTVAEARQPVGYDPVRDTISELAGRDAADAWIMITCLVLLGCCYLAVAAVLHAAGLPSRFLLATGGVATIALVAFPRPMVGGSLSHGVAATVAVLALVLWPAGSALRLPRGQHGGRPAHPEPPWAFRRAVGLSAAAVLLVLFGWCAFEVTSGSRTGLAERVTAVAVSLWPLLAVLSARRAHLAEVAGGTVRIGPDLAAGGVVPPDPLGPNRGPTPRRPDRLPESSRRPGEFRRPPRSARRAARRHTPSPPAWRSWHWPSGRRWPSAVNRCRPSAGSSAARRAGALSAVRHAGRRSRRRSCSDWWAGSASSSSPTDRGSG